MTGKNQFRVALVTVPDARLAEKLAKGLVAEKFAACVSVVPGLVSHYYWKGKPRKESELLLIIKTRAGLMPQLIAYVRENHSAEVPEILSLPVMEGDKDYLNWLGANTLFTKPAEDQKIPL